MTSQSNVIYVWPWRGCWKLLRLRPGDRVIVTGATNHPGRVEGTFIRRSGRNVTLEIDRDV